MNSDEQSCDLCSEVWNSFPGGCLCLLRRLLTLGKSGAEIVPRITIVWFDPQGLLVLLDCFIQPTRSDERVAYIVVGLREIRLEPQRLLVMVDGLWDSAGVAQCNP